MVMQQLPVTTSRNGWIRLSIRSQPDGIWVKTGLLSVTAEVLLTYAEAKNELSPLDPSAFDAVNQVRRRVGMLDLQKTVRTKPTYCGLTLGTICVNVSGMNGV